MSDSQTLPAQFRQVWPLFLGNILETRTRSRFRFGYSYTRAPQGYIVAKSEAQFSGAGKQIPRSRYISIALTPSMDVAFIASAYVLSSIEAGSGMHNRPKSSCFSRSERVCSAKSSNYGILPDFQTCACGAAHGTH